MICTVKLEWPYFHFLQFIVQRTSLREEQQDDISYWVIFSVLMSRSLSSFPHVLVSVLIIWWRKSSWEGCMSGGNSIFTWHKDRNHSYYLLLVIGPCPYMQYKLRVKGDKYPIAVHTYNCTSFEFRRGSALLWYRSSEYHWKISRADGEQLRTVFTWIRQAYCVPLAPTTCILPAKNRSTAVEHQHC